jgi:hypothetical protein
MFLSAPRARSGVPHAGRARFDLEIAVLLVEAEAPFQVP